MNHEYAYGIDTFKCIDMYNIVLLTVLGENA